MPVINWPELVAETLDCRLAREWSPCWSDCGVVVLVTQLTHFGLQVKIKVSRRIHQKVPGHWRWEHRAESSWDHSLEMVSQEERRRDPRTGPVREPA